MRPLVRVFIQRGVTAPAFYKLLKRVYVDVAYSDFRLEGEPPTDSRVSLLTGVHRKDVKDILTSERNEWMEARAKTATFSTVLSRWLTLPEYQGEDGAPRALPRSSAEGLSFDGLVRAVNKDIRPRTILDELLRQEMVQLGEDGLLRVSQNAVLGDTPEDHKLVYFAANVGDHIAAAAENLSAETAPFFERAVFYNRLSTASVDDVEGNARQLAQAMLEELNAQSAVLQHADVEAGKTEERYRLGVYFYREKSDIEVDGAREDTREDDD